MTGLCAPSTCMAGHQATISMKSHMNPSMHQQSNLTHNYRAVLTLLCSVRPRGLAIKARVLMHVRGRFESLQVCGIFSSIITCPNYSVFVLHNNFGTVYCPFLLFFVFFLWIFSFIGYFHVLYLHKYIRTPPK
jgi:hypothetical protein